MSICILQLLYLYYTTLLLDQRDGSGGDLALYSELTMVRLADSDSLLDHPLSSSTSSSFFTSTPTSSSAYHDNNTAVRAGSEGEGEMQEVINMTMTYLKAAVIENFASVDGEYNPYLCPSGRLDYMVWHMLILLVTY